MQGGTGILKVIRYTDINLSVYIANECFLLICTGVNNNSIQSGRFCWLNEEQEAKEMESMGKE